MSALPRLLPLVLALAGCSKLFGQKPPPQAAPAPLATPPEAAKEAGHEPVAAVGHKEEEQAARYGVPFAWESSPNEPLAKARGFLADVLRANQANVALGRPHFTPFADGQTPRATVLSCADSRVQASAWDLTPENDDFTVRNIGNQVSNALGAQPTGEGNVLAQAGTVALYSSSPPDVSLLPMALTQTEGPGGRPHENMPPYVAVGMYVICVDGMIPERPGEAEE